MLNRGRAVALPQDDICTEMISIYWHFEMILAKKKSFCFALVVLFSFFCHLILG